MLSKAILFILGLVVGAAACAAIMNGRHQQQLEAQRQAVSSAAAAAYTNQIAELNASLAGVRNQIEKMHQVDDQLAAQVQKHLKREADAPLPDSAAPKGLAALFGGGTNGMTAMSGMMKTMMTQQAEGKLDALKTRLNLTAEQQAAIWTIMTNQMDRSTSMVQKMFQGGLSNNDLTNTPAVYKSEDEQIKALLTPDQATAYDQYQQEEKSNSARMMADAEVMQMQSTLQLDEDQQNKVYEVLYNQTQSQFDAPTNDINPTMNAMDSLSNRLTQKIEALRSVLTPDQLGRYQKYQQQQMQMIEAFMPKGMTN